MNIEDKDECKIVIDPNTTVTKGAKSFILEFTRTSLIWTPVACSGEFKYEVQPKLLHGLSPRNLS